MSRQAEMSSDELSALSWRRDRDVCVELLSSWWNWLATYHSDQSIICNTLYPHLCRLHLLNCTPPAQYRLMSLNVFEESTNLFHF